MNEKIAFEIVQRALKPRRYEHTERVVEEATQLCHRFGGDLETIRMASILHDYAKYRSSFQMREEVMKNKRLPVDLLRYGDELLHSFVGAEMVRKELDIEDERIIDAIKYHTTGRSNMSLEEKIVFLADYIEPGRDFPHINETRELATKDLDAACLLALKNTITYLVEKNVTIYPYTFEAYNSFTMQKENRNE